MLPTFTLFFCETLYVHVIILTCFFPHYYYFLMIFSTGKHRGINHAVANNEVPIKSRELPTLIHKEGPVDQDWKVVKEPELSVQVASRSSRSNNSDEKKTGRLHTRFDMLPLTSIQRAGEVNNEE